MSEVPSNVPLSIAPLSRRPCRTPDLLYLASIASCYSFAAYAQWIMPDGVTWGLNWEYAHFVMTVAAQSSLVLFVAGLISVWKIGPKRTAIIDLLGLCFAAALPILMFFFAKRWLQGNFA